MIGTKHHSRKLVPELCKSFVKVISASIMKLLET